VLAHFVGPIARVMVRQAAKAHRDLAGLTSAIDQQLPSDADRQRFHARLGETTRGLRITAATPLHTPASAPAVAGTGRPMSPEVVAAALRILTKRMGPIASVLVKRSAAKAQTQEQFHTLLAEQAAEGDEREQLLAALHRGL
jgi:serine/threonine-protein kinase